LADPTEAVLSFVTSYVRCPYVVSALDRRSARPPFGSIIATHHVTRYIRRMIRTFADRRTQQICEKGSARRFPADVTARAARKLEYVDLATSLEDLKVPPGNRLHALKGDRRGQYAISINDQWRICFRFEDGDAYDVEVCDYNGAA
jgi:toxin HigB-1